METIEQKSKTNIFIYIIIAILLVAIVVVYFVFFAPEKLATSETPTMTPVTNTAVEEVGSSPVAKTTLAPSVSRSTSTDVTGGLSSLKLTPEDILNNPIFQSLRAYAEPVEVPTLGRPNPFIPY